MGVGGRTTTGFLGPGCPRLNRGSSGHPGIGHGRTCGSYIHEGYWGPHVGFYGGINYGFGYGGVGFEGGYWQGGRFYYNRAIANVSETNVRDVYTKTVIHNTINVVSYNGGKGGITARPTSVELRATAERHVPPVAAQNEHMNLARNNPHAACGIEPWTTADRGHFSASANSKEVV